MQVRSGSDLGSPERRAGGGVSSGSFRAQRGLRGRISEAPPSAGRSQDFARRFGRWLRVPRAGSAEGPAGSARPRSPSPSPPPPFTWRRGPGRGAGSAGPRDRLMPASQRGRRGRWPVAPGSGRDGAAGAAAERRIASGWNSQGRRLRGPRPAPPRPRRIPPSRGTSVGLAAPRLWPHDPISHGLSAPESRT